MCRRQQVHQQVCLAVRGKQFICILRFGSQFWKFFFVTNNVTGGSNNSADGSRGKYISMSLMTMTTLIMVVLKMVPMFTKVLWRENEEEDED